jgi:hypothetical protein
MIDFEKDQQDAMKRTDNIQSLADQVERLEAMQQQLEIQEDAIKEKKKQIQHLSGEVIPTMMSEMGLAELKLHDGSHLKVSTSYRATITEANKESAFNWLRENGLGDIIKNEISVSFGRNEDNKAADYAELAKGQGFQPTQKMKVEPMTLKALVRERIEAGALATFDMEADANKGAQNISQEDLALPFLKILGQLSPEVNKRDGKYVEGAEPGKIINTVTNQLYDSLEVVPVFYKRQYIEWQDRGTSTGAPVAIHDADSDIISQTTRGKDYKDRLPNGNYLENTASHFVLTIGDSPSTALISMKSTQLKVSRKWNSMMMGIKMQGKNGLFTPPTYSHIYKLSTVQMSNDKGTWFGWDVSKVGPVTEKTIYDSAKAFAESVGKGEIQAKHGTEETTKSNSNY